MKLAALIQHVRRRQKQEVDRGQAVGVGPQKNVCTERERMAFPSTKNQDYGACKGQQKHKAKTKYIYV